MGFFLVNKIVCWVYKSFLYIFLGENRLKLVFWSKKPQPKKLVDRKLGHVDNASSCSFFLKIPPTQLEKAIKRVLGASAGLTNPHTWSYFLRPNYVAPLNLDRLALFLSTFNNWDVISKKTISNLKYIRYIILLNF